MAARPAPPAFLSVNRLQYLVTYRSFPERTGMRKSPYSNGAAAVEELARGSAIPCSDTSIADSWRRSAENDATCDYAPNADDEVALRAFAAGGPGDVPTADAPYGEWPMSYEVYQAARARQSAAIATLIAAAIQAAGAFARRAYARYQQRRQARGIRVALGELDDRTLHDLGFNRDEIASIAAETTGRAECSRLRVLQTLYGPPK